MRRIVTILCVFVLSCAICRAKSLEVYFVDVEGGQATLIVAPSGQSLLVDAGWPGFNGRDADRILAAAHEAGLERIDYLLVTHYHVDHVGGVPPLAAKIPIGTFVDHGASVESGDRAEALVAAYKPLTEKAGHLVAKPGDKIPIEGLEAEVLAAAGRTITTPLNGAGQPNLFCSAKHPGEEGKGENPQSVGILIQYGKFRLIDLGDLTWEKERHLACPENRIGKVDVYLTTHHGNPDSGSAAIVHALGPRVAVMNNGARKGGTPEAFQVIHTSPGLEDLWQLHYAIPAGGENNAPERFIANMDAECHGYAIKLVVNQDGTFTVSNTRNNFTKRYDSQ